jgi:TPR repeat protein
MGVVGREYTRLNAIVKEAGSRGDDIAVVNALQELVNDFDDERAMTQLAERYDTGKGVPQDRRKAVELYAQAALLGDSVASYWMAVETLKGERVKQDLNAALNYARKAAEWGNQQAAPLASELESKVEALRARQAAERARQRETLERMKRSRD